MTFWYLSSDNQMGLCSFFFFFFSSRRRHTRLQGDWSSDVCSSDLCRNFSVGLFVAEPSSMTGSRPISTTVSGAGGPCGSEFARSQRKKYSSERCRRGSRRNKTPESKTTIIIQREGRCIEQE